ncbi:MAG: peptidylprolyl isomerase [Kiritimatiellaeota bacterium]|nr:peptidylprolyl isomerase [Kiritimatiellota bacterium]
MNRSVFALMVFGLLVAGAGCPKAPVVPGVIVAEKQRPLAELSPNDVIVSVNGAKLTKKDWEARMSLHMALYAYGMPNATAQKRDSFRKSREQRTILEYVNTQLALQDTRRLKIEVPPDSVREAEQAIINSYTKGRSTPDDFYRALGVNAEPFKRQVKTDLLVKKTRQALYADRLAVSESDIDAFEKKTADWNAVYMLSNQVVVASGEELVRQLRAGADFAETARAVSQHQPEDGVLWGEFVRSEIEDPKLAELAFTLPVGAVSDPVETEEGLVIIKVLERTGGTQTESAVSLNVSSVKLARILLFMYTAWEERTRPQIRKELERSRVSEVQQEWLAKQWGAARIEYPNGTNLWPRVRNNRGTSNIRRALQP